MTLPRRVGINAVFLEPRMGGVETYLRELVPELVRLAPQTSFRVTWKSTALGTLQSYERTWKARA